MATNQTKLPLFLKIHNMTCFAWTLKIGWLRKLEPGCRAAQKRVDSSSS